MYQFVHVESYSRAAPKTAIHANKKSGKVSGKIGRCVKFVVDEAIRAPGSTAHIDNPLPPIYHYGKPLEELAATCDDWAASVKDASGHKLRKDALCLLAGVVSAPNAIDEEAWGAFREDVIKWLKEKYGDQLQTIIEHIDEEHPHLHFYVVPKLGCRFESEHEGRAAAITAKAEGGKKALQNQAYKAAMRGFQDDFYDKVGIEHGFTRIGPGRRRLTNEEHKLELIQAAAAAHAIAKARERVEISEEQAEAIVARARSEARKISQKTLQKADEIERKAAEKGFISGLDAVEKLPWWKKLSAVLKRAVTERDQLREKVSSLEEKASTASKWEAKARKFFGLNQKNTAELNELKPKLYEAEREAEQVGRLKKTNSILKDQLAQEMAIRASTEERLKDVLKQLEPEKGSAKRPAERAYESSLDH